MKTCIGLATLAAVAIPLSTALPSTASAQRFCNEMPIETEPQDPGHGCDIGGPIGTTDPTRPSSGYSSQSTNDAEGNTELDRLVAELNSEE